MAANEVPPLQVEEGLMGFHIEQPDLSRIQTSAFVPPEIRLGFVKKVYSIVGALLIVTVAFACFPIFRWPNSLNTQFCDQCLNSTSTNMTNINVDFGDGRGLVNLTGNLTAQKAHCATCITHATLRSFVVQVYIFIVWLPPIIFCAAKCCPFVSCLQTTSQNFDYMMKTPPWNYIYLFMFAVCEGLFVSVLLENVASNRRTHVAIIGITLVLTLMTVTYSTALANDDFSGNAAYTAMLIGTIVPFCVSFLIDGNASNAVGIAFFTGLLSHGAIRETKAIFGVGGDPSRHQFTYDMYAYAAYHVYLTAVVFVGLGC